MYTISRMDLYKKFEKYMSQILFFLQNDLKKIAVAVSGGSDSLALTFLLNNYCKKNDIELLAYTLNHRLRPEAHEEVKYVKFLLSGIGIKTKILTWNHENNLKIGHLEREARDARYKIFSEECVKDNVSVLAVGHTFNDQLETYMIRKEMGSGDIGLAGISAIKYLWNGVRIIRPMLLLYKDDLRTFLDSINVKWVEDESNNMTVFSRVRFRKEFLSNKLLEEDVSEKVKHLAMQRHVLDEQINNYIKDNFIFKEFYVELSNEFNIYDEVALFSLRNVIWRIGGMKYPCCIKSLLENLKKNITFTISRVVLEFNKKSIIIYRENKNFEKIKFRNYVFWDNRFIIKAKDDNEYFVSNFSIEKIRQLKESNKISKNIKERFLVSLPAIFDKNLNLISVPGICYNESNFVVEFISEVYLNERFIALHV